MKEDISLSLCEQLETLSTKCRVANTELARNYIACQACYAYVKYMYTSCPIVVKKSLLTSNKVSELWCTVLDYYPGCIIDRDALDNVERYIQNPTGYHLSDGDVRSVYKLLAQLSKLVHDLVM